MNGRNGQQTPLSAALHMRTRLDQLDTVIAELRVADDKATDQRHTADVEYAKAILESRQGNETKRKAEAFLATEELEFAAKKAEVAYRHLVKRVRAAEKRVDAGRTYSADLRAEFQTLGRTGDP